LALLRQAEHVLFVALLGLGVVRAAADGPYAWWAVGLGLFELGWYVAGVVLARRPLETGRRRRAAAGWLIVLSLGWVGLVVVSAAFVWLVFALFLLYLQAIPRRWSLPVVSVLTGIAIVATATRQGLSAAVVVGPVIGAAVAVVITVVYRDLRDEAERRARLLRELTAAQERLAAAERYAGTLAERERLAREIHDTVAQSLTSVVLLLRAAGTEADRLPGSAQARLEAATAAAKGALEDARAVVRALAPADLAGRSLADALRRLVDDTAPVGIDVGFTVDGDPYELATTTAVALLRTAQGALGNVIAHSMARRARVTLTYQPGQVSLDVADDGCGFDPAARPGESGSGTGIGLASMRSRLAEVGGRLEVESRPGAGTAIGATIPTAAAGG